MVSMAKEPNSSHIMQLQVYLHYLRIQHGMIVYVEKNTLQSRSFPVEYDPKVAEEAIQRFRRLHLALTKGEIPEPEARLKPDRKWECGYCAWKEGCWGGEEKI
ncbi:MAG: Dna2/Cas4 domain-containing protein, partial [Candidatus Aenigmatarchaeota archaeon]